MEILVGIFALFFALLVIGFFIVMVRKARQVHATRHLEAENLGFHYQDPPDPGLVARITGLHARYSSHKLVLRQVFVKPQGETTLYLLDLVDTGGEDSSLLLDGAITIVSPLLHLPHFGLFPRIPGEGFWAQAANQLFERLFGRNAPLVDFDDRPAFDKHYLVTSPEPEQVRELLSDFIQDRLSSLEMLQIQAGGDTLTVANVGYAQFKPDQPRNLDLLYRQALTIFDLLRRSQLEE
jgi:hypothetical protein